MQRSPQFASPPLGVQLAGVSQGMAVDREHGVEFRPRAVDPFDALQIGARQLFRGDLAIGHGGLLFTRRGIGTDCLGLSSA